MSEDFKKFSQSISESSNSVNLHENTDSDLSDFGDKPVEKPKKTPKIKPSLTKQKKEQQPPKPETAPAKSNSLLKNFFNKEESSIFPNTPEPKPPKPTKKTNAQAKPDTLSETFTSIVSKLNGYQNKLPFLMKEKEQETWNYGDNNCSETYARDLLNKIRTRMKARRKDLIVNMMFDKMCDLSEQGMVQLLQQSNMLGFSSYIKENKPLFQEDLDEIAIEMPDDYVPGPKIRLGMAILSLVEKFKVEKKIYAAQQSTK